MPLAQDLIGQQTGSNPGLALTRLAPPLEKQSWTRHLESIVGGSPPSGYDDHFRRVRARTAAGPAHRRVLVAASLSPTLCGMGERTPGENGLTLHPVYGVPYLPGTSLKGILRAWVVAQDWGPQWALDGEHFRVLFGQGGSTGVAAAVDLLDALPFPGGSMFTIDVLTPHFAEYYQGKDAPRGWEGPNPVHFLAAAKGIRYRVVVEGAPGWVDKAAEWLALALSERGIGAKSRAGYGRFECEPLDAAHPAEREAAGRNEKARQTRADRAEEELRAHGRDIVRQEVEKWLRGEAVGASFSALLPSPPAAAPAARVAAVRAVGDTWSFRADWEARATNARADEAKRSRARELIAAWASLFPPPTAVQAVVDPGTATSSSRTEGGAGSPFGSAAWSPPKDGMKANRVADAFARRAGTPDAPSEAAVRECLAWLRAHGKQGQIDQVRRAYQLDQEG